jgi:pimeloyl-ACP methyl ester carboxylesterase
LTRVTTTFTFQNSTLSYQKIGQGPHVVFAFHGFGQTGEVFEPLANPVANIYSCYCFDLFYHGKSTWGDVTPLEKKKLKELFIAFTTELGIQKFSVLGFSMGARFALTLVETMPQYIENSCMVAPDGLVKNLWHTLATASAVNRILFKRLTTHPRALINLTKFLIQLRIIKPSLGRFVQHQLRIPHNGLRIYNTWTQFRKLEAHPATLNTSLSDYDLTLRIISGIGDDLIDKSKLFKASAFTKQYEFIAVNAAHHNLLSYLERQGLHHILRGKST